MDGLSERGFGYLIAFGLPGFLLLWGLSFSFPSVASWMATASADKAPSVAGFLFTTVASFALGLLLDAVTWLVLETALYKLTNLPAPNIDDHALARPEVLSAFQAAVENHYRYYQCYANSLLVMALVVPIYLVHSGQQYIWWYWFGILALVLILGWKARDELSSFNGRATDITHPSDDSGANDAD